MDDHSHIRTPAQSHVARSDHRRWVISGPPRSGKSTVLVDRLARRWLSGRDAGRMLIVAQDRRSVLRLRSMFPDIPDDAIGEPELVGYAGLAQRLIRRYWPLVAGKFGVLSTTPEFLAFDLTQYACLLEYRKDPGALQRLTMREQRLVVQIIDNMNLAASNGLSLSVGWERVASGRGVAPDHEVIQQGLAVSERFREHCVAAGVMPFDLQVEACNWLLEQELVQTDLRRQFDTLAIDALDEFVPSIARSLTSLAAAFDEVDVTFSSDGGLRWILGASFEQAEIVKDRLLAGDQGFKQLLLRRELSASPVVRSGSAEWLAQAAFYDPAGAAPSSEGWLFTISGRSVEMASQVAGTVTALVREGIPGQGVVIIAPIIEPLVANELERRLNAEGIPFQIEQRQQALYDDRFSRACVTALRGSGAGSQRAPSLVEISELAGLLQGVNPVDAHRLARQIYDPQQLRLRTIDEMRVELPVAMKKLLAWAEHAGDRRIDAALETLASEVISQSDAPRRNDLLDACHRLIQQAVDFLRVAPRFGLTPPYTDPFFDYIDSYVQVTRPVDPDDDSVLLTTPYAFLTSGRSARYQCWLDVASPVWWQPPSTVLTAPYLMASAPVSPPKNGARREFSARQRVAEPSGLGYDAEERQRNLILARLIRNLAAHCDDGIFAFASRTSTDGRTLDGPLLDGFYLLGAPSR